MLVKIEAKKDGLFKCIVKTIDGSATAPDDYDHEEKSF